MAGRQRGLQVVVTGDVAGLQRALRQAQGEVTGFARTAGKVGSRMNAVGAGMRRVGAGLTRGVTLPIVAVAAAAGKLAASFEQQMSRVQAATGASSKTMKQLSDAALKAGADTAYSAQEAAVAQTELAKGGLSAATILRGALDGALSLAAAGELELGEAASTTVNALKAFGLGGQQATTVADALAKAANVTTADVADFGMALKQVGGVANTAGLTFHQTVTGLEALAEAGVKNSDAGTSMKAAIQQLLGPSTKQKALQDELNLSFVTAAGKMKGAAAIAQMLRGRLGGMTQAQRLATLKTLAGADGVRYLTSLYQAGAPKLQAYSRGLHDQGYAADVARTKQDNLAGKLEQLRGSLETAGIVIGTALIPPLTDLAVKATGAVNAVAHAFQSLTPEAQQLVLVIAGIAAATGPVIWALGGMVSGLARVRAALVLLPGGAILPLIAAFGLLTGNARLVQAALGALAGALIGALIAKYASAAGETLQFVRALLTVEGAATAAGIGMTRLKAAIATNPIGLLMTALGAAVGALGLFSSKTDDAKMSQQALADSVLATRTAIDRLRDADLTAAEAKVRAREATLNLKRAIQERNRVQKDEHSTALQQREADVAVQRAKIDLERATRQANRADRDYSATRKKDVAEAREQIQTRKDHYQSIIDENEAILKSPQGLLADRQAREQWRRKVEQARKSLQAAERDERQLAKAMESTAGDAQAAGQKIGASRGGVDSLRQAMSQLGNVRPSFSGFIGAIQGAMATAGSIVDQAVDAMRAKLAQASPNKRGSPAPTDVVADGFDELNTVVASGMRRVAKTAGAGVDDFRSQLYPLDAEIRQLTAAGDRLERSFDRADRAAEKRALKRRAGRKIQDVPGVAHGTGKRAQRRNAHRQDVKQRNADTRAARDELHRFNVEQGRAQKLRRLDLQIAGLERIKAAQDAIAAVREQLVGLADEAAQKFREVKEQAIDVALQNALAAFDPAQAARRKVALDSETQAVLDLQAAERKLSTEREDRNQQRAVEDAKRNVEDAKRAEQEAIANVAAAEANLERVRKSQSPRLIAAAESDLADARRAQADAARSVVDAEQGVADAIVDIEATARQRQIEALENSIATRQQKLQDDADDQKGQLDGQTAVYQTALQAQLDALVTNLEQRKSTYAEFATAVQAILGPLGLAFTPDPEAEGALGGGLTGGKKKKRRRRGHRASGGLQMLRDRVMRVGETGAEDVYLPRGSRVRPASRSRGREGSVHHWAIDLRGSGLTVDQVLDRAAKILDRKGL